MNCSCSRSNINSNVKLGDVEEVNANISDLEEFLNFDIELSINWDDELKLNPDIFGFSTAFMFKNGFGDQKEVLELLSHLKTPILRFPGGTVANYYHPDGQGYGFIHSEVVNTKAMLQLYQTQSQANRNFIYSFIELAQAQNAQVLLVANLLTGTIEETLAMIEMVKAANLEIAGIELGNEYYFKEYWKEYPSVDTYIAQSKSFAKAIRAQYPEMKIAVVAADVVDEQKKGAYNLHMIDWHRKMGQEDFYDAYVSHMYLPTKSCESLANGDVEVFMNCIKDVICLQNHRFMDIVLPFYKKYYGNKNLWITEWNVNPPFNYIGNTIAQASMATEFIFETIESQKDYGSMVELMTYHLLASEGHGYALVTNNKQKLPNVNDNLSVSLSPTYFPFLFYSDIVASGAKYVDSKLVLAEHIDAKDLSMQSYFDYSNNVLFVVYTNRSGKQLSVILKDEEIEKISLKEVSGDHLRSSGGSTGFVNKQASLFSPIRYIDKELDSSTTTINGYSVGCFQIKLNGEK